MVNYKKLVVLLLALIIFVSFKCFVMNNMQISGNSMANSYINNDVVMVEKISHKFKINRFDVVIVSATKDGIKGKIIKRVIGLPNETVCIKSGNVYINDQLLEGDIAESISDGGLASEPFVLGDNEYFVLGDNRNASEDSRYEWLGAVNKSNIIGKPFFRIFPLQRIGKVN